MTYPIIVRQFDYGDQGRERHVETILRKVHTSSYYGPASHGCCTGVVKKHTYLWIEYRGIKHVLQRTHHWPSLEGPEVPYEIVLPSPGTARY